MRPKQQPVDDPLGTSGLLCNDYLLHCRVIRRHYNRIILSSKLQEHLKSQQNYTHTKHSAHRVLFIPWIDFSLNKWGWSFGWHWLYYDLLQIKNSSSKSEKKKSPPMGTSSNVIWWSCVSINGRMLCVRKVRNPSQHTQVIIVLPFPSPSIPLRPDVAECMQMNDGRSLLRKGE